jgi:hypothetical protein
MPKRPGPETTETVLFTIAQREGEKRSILLEDIFPNQIVRFVFRPEKNVPHEHLPAIEIAEACARTFFTQMLNSRWRGSFELSVQKRVFAGKGEVRCATREGQWALLMMYDLLYNSVCRALSRHEGDITVHIEIGRSGSSSTREIREALNPAPPSDGDDEDHDTDHHRPNHNSSS